MILANGSRVDRKNFEHFKFLRRFCCQPGILLFANHFAGCARHKDELWGEEGRFFTYLSKTLKIYFAIRFGLAF